MKKEKLGNPDHGFIFLICPSYGAFMFYIYLTTIVQINLTGYK